MQYLFLRIHFLFTEVLDVENDFHSCLKSYPKSEIFAAGDFGAPLLINQAECWIGI